jgi:hypothetical protein
MRIVRELKNPTSREDVIEALKSERAYQRRRWGFRQTDGTMIEASHDIYEWVLYIQDYLNEGLHGLSRKPDAEAYKFALDSLRKCVTMAIAACESENVDPYNQPEAYAIRPTTGKAPETAGVEWFYLYIQQAINQYISVLGHRDTEGEQNLILRKVINTGIACFERFGISKRDLTVPIINGRDSQLA